MSKGQQCTISGKCYEIVVFNTINTLMYNNYQFTSQLEKNLGGSTNGIDLICNYNNKPNIGIEIKKKNTPDWMQCSIKYYEDKKKWCGSEHSKIPVASREIFNNLLKNSILFNNKIPPFVKNRIKHSEWLDIKKNTTDFKDIYIDIPNTTIRDIYKEKGCYYIQVSNRGLYHLGNDIYKFGVPEFIVDQQIRIRTKIHKICNKQGYCNMSVMAACQPRNINLLVASKYSLDTYARLPKGLLPRVLTSLYSINKYRWF
tara:strand:- start:83 stop:853 length:771 start_codon:yes stop_codon:yes gene_type:complete